jgi:hypothetical protein
MFVKQNAIIIYDKKLLYYIVHNYTIHIFLFMTNVYVFWYITNVHVLIYIFVCFKKTIVVDKKIAITNSFYVNYVLEQQLIYIIMCINEISLTIIIIISQC